MPPNPLVINLNRLLSGQLNIEKLKTMLHIQLAFTGGQQTKDFIMNNQRKTITVLAEIAK